MPSCQPQEPKLRTPPESGRRRPRRAAPLPAGERAALPLKEAAAYIGCGRTTLYRLVNRGALKPLKIGRSTLFRVDDLRALLDRAGTPGAVTARGGAE